MWQMMTFLRPLDVLIPKIPFLGLGHLQGPGVNLGRILGVLSIEPFLGEGGVQPGGSIDPRPPQLKARPPLPLTPSAVRDDLGQSRD